MSKWFLIALITPILHAFANHIDKHLIFKYFKAGGVGSLVLFSSIFAFLVLPIIYFIYPSVLVISFNSSLFLILNGILGLAYVIFYLYALEEEEASIVAPFFQLIPVLGFILGYFILGEILNARQIYASLSIIVGAFLLSLDIGNGFKIKKKLLLLMFSASFLYALTNTIFKLIALDVGFVASLFWTMVGQVFLGVILYLTVTSYRRQFLLVLKENSLSVVGLNLFNGMIILAGDIVLFYALLLAPVTLVLAVSGFQPLFVLMIGIFLTIFFPNFNKESFDKKIFIQKMVCILIIIIGSIFIN